MVKDKKIAIDFDGTITEQIPYKPYKYGKIRNSIRLSMRLLSIRGWYIIIWTSRSWAEKDKIIAFLAKNGVLFDEVICCKPIADYYIDEKAINDKEFVKGKIR